MSPNWVPQYLNGSCPKNKLDLTKICGPLLNFIVSVCKNISIDIYIYIIILLLYSTIYIYIYISQLIQYDQFFDTFPFSELGKRWIPSWLRSVTQATRQSYDQHLPARPWDFLTQTFGVRKKSVSSLYGYNNGYMTQYVYIYNGCYNIIYIYISWLLYTCTSSTAQGGGGSFKNRKPIGKVGCCESGMAERIH